MIVEPCARNTAAAIALAVVRAEPDELLLVMPSDHVITDVPAFLEAIARAEEAARQGWLITFGVQPTHAETGYGYIRVADELLPGVFRTGAFVEKPAPDVAQLYLDEGCYLWNAGIFLVQAAALRAEMAEHAPEILSAVEAAMAEGASMGSRFYPEPHSFASAPSQAIDRAVMERSSRVAAVPVTMGWSDVGSWDALYAVGRADDDGNVVSGNAHARGSKGCLVRSEGPMVVASGVENLIIVATANEVLILPRGKSQLAQRAAEAAKGERG
jgi:mannose-1-phosphate guanylyltransferase/mannose-1-phosphate guanylyltransferase/mannose-6-phosphate isomerase